MLKHLISIAIAGMTASSYIATAQPIAIVGEQFVGRYEGEKVDLASELVILSNQTFCLGVMAGILELKVGGRWKPLVGAGYEKGVSAIRLMPVRPPRPAFWISPTQMNDGTKESSSKRVIMFSGRAFSRADGVFIGFELNDLRPVFSRRHRQYSLSYNIAIPKGSMRLYVGIPPTEKDAGMPSVAQVWEYSIDDMRFDTIGLNYDRSSAKPLKEFVAKLERERLSLENDEGVEIFTRRNGAISDDLRQSTEKMCINPALTKDGPRNEQDIGLSPSLRTIDVPWPLVERPSWIAPDN